MLGHLGIIGEIALKGEARAKSGNALYGAYGQDFLCADGRRVMVIGPTDRQWRGIVKVTGTVDAMVALAGSLGVDLNQEGERWKARERITEILKPWFAARSVADFAEDFEAAGLTWSEFRDFKQALDEDPDLSPENPMFSMLGHPGVGRYPVPGTPLNFSSFEREGSRERRIAIGHFSLYRARERAALSAAKTSGREIIAQAMAAFVDRRKGSNRAIARNALYLRLKISMAIANCAE